MRVVRGLGPGWVALLLVTSTGALAQSGLNTTQTLGRHAPTDIQAFKRPINVRDASLVPGVVTQAGLSLAAEKYLAPALDGQFSVDLAGARIVPVQLTVSNNSRVKILVSRQVRMGASGPQPLTGAQLFERTERSAKGSGVLLNIMSLGAATSGLRQDTETANEAVAANFHLKSLRDSVLLPGETVSGFVFFDEPLLKGAGNHLVVPVLSLDRVAQLLIDVPVSGLDGGAVGQGQAVASAPTTATTGPTPGTIAATAAAPAVAAPVAPAPVPAGPRQAQMQLPNGDRYEGEVVGTVRSGQGRYLYANGDRYEGRFLNDRAHGRGVHWYAHGDRYDGQFSDGVQSGTATYHYASGDRYVGSFVAGLRDGQGVHYFASGDRYEGAFQRGDLAGQGTYFYANGDRYVGSFAKGVRHGPGTYYFKAGEVRPMVFQNGKEVPP